MTRRKLERSRSRPDLRPLSVAFLFLLSEFSQDVLEDGAVPFANFVELDAKAYILSGMAHFASKHEVAVGDIQHDL